MTARRVTRRAVKPVDAREAKLRLVWENARITATHLGYEDHGALTCVLTCETGHVVQGFGCRVLNVPEAFQNFFKGVLAVVGVDRWEQVVGHTLRVAHEGNSGPIVAIRPLIKNVPVFAPGNDLHRNDGLDRGPD